ncbi:hypothetical protein BDK51DRAFT_15297, partial [Blyttiomyces helicus]
RRKLWLATTLCFAFFLVELAAGLYAGSLAILSDSFHLLSDIAGFAISLVALYLAQQPATARHSFGFHRAEIIGAIVSTFLIWMLTAVLVYEAIDRVRNPQPIDGPVMFGTALVGVFVNIILGLTLHGEHGHSHGEEEAGKILILLHCSMNINVQSAAIHVIGDLLSSIGVLIAASAIWINPDLTILDPICTFVFSVFVLATTIQLMSNS